MVVVAKGKAPFRAVLSHGFVLDERGMKMSKSLGNVVAPAKIIAGDLGPKKEASAGGTDLLRLWAISSDFTNDIALSPQGLGSHSLSQKAH